MKVWHLDAIASLKKLDICGVCIPDFMLSPKVASRYELSTIKYREDLNAFWESAKSYNFQDNEDLLKLHEQFGLNSHYETNRWYEQLGSMIGASSKVAVATAVKPGERHNSTYYEYLFTGGYWRDVLIIPSYDIPGRIVGLWIVGRKGKYPEDWLFRRIDSTPTKIDGIAEDIQETGIAFMDAIMPYSKQFKDTAFIVDDPLMALRIQGRHFRDHGYPLPLGLAYEGPQGSSKRVWGYSPNKEWIFYAEKPNRNIFGWAQRASGKVVFSPFKPDRDLRYHMAWLKKLKEKAVPWQEGLANAAELLTDAEIEDILMHLTMKEEDVWAAFIEKVPEDQRERLEILHKRKWPYPTVTSGHYRITERPEGWILEQSGELITDVMLCITHAVRKRESGGQVETYLRGWFKYKDKKYPIAGSTVRMTRSVSTMIIDTLIKARAGVPRIAPMWRNRLLDLALKFHQPKIICVKAKVKSGKVQHHNKASSTRDI